ncbi:hypothetical protein RB195_022501 [Necator americanus]|uniref:Uncharacterized protein n=1 Tax=Necator americanus TaxID=51031 RepID=A0ABR1EFJ3_NECAM
MHSFDTVSHPARFGVLRELLIDIERPKYITDWQFTVTRRSCWRRVHASDAAPLLTRVVSVLNMSDQIVSCVHSKPSAQFSTDVVVIPRVSADYVSVENNTQKRMIREELVSSQVYCPDVKRPRCQDADVKEVEPRIINDFITKTCLSEISIKAKSFEKKNVSVLVYSNPSTAYTE